LKKYSDADRRCLKILEIGTGSGAISVALATELKNASIVATDISREALDVAIKNAENNSVDHRISFRLGSLFEPVSEKFDMIVSNPPYIAEGSFDSLPVSVRKFEPKVALVAGIEGTEIHQEIMVQGYCHLNPEGRLFMEMGADQKNRISEMLDELNLYDEIAFLRDYAGLDRVFTARRKKEAPDG
jgi:release factor glutamine methyltransferase